MRRLLWPTIAAVAGVAILVSLGVWQLHRLAWKEALIARIEAGRTSKPVPAPGPDAWGSLDVAAAEYRPVTVTGRYLNDAEIFVNETLTEPHGPRGGYGFFVMTPFATDAGWIVYVNRGFIPRRAKAAATRSADMIAGETTEAGLLRQPRQRAWFMPADNVAGNEWFSRDPALFARAQGRQPTTVAPYYIDAFFDPDLPGGLPQGGETIISFPNNHLQYALTWFALAIVLSAVFAMSAWRRLRETG